MPARGFSFRLDGPLDMRMGGDGPSAADVVNRIEPRDLARVIAVLGEEKRARAVASAIARARARGAAHAARPSWPRSSRARSGVAPTDKIHPATRTFQALRIFVNRELDELAEALAASERMLAEGGRLVVVAFHSLEDRIVKRFLAERSDARPRGSRHVPEATIADADLRTPDARGAGRPARTRSRAIRGRARRGCAPRGAPLRRRGALDRRAIGVPELPAFEMGRS